MRYIVAVHHPDIIDGRKIYDVQVAECFVKAAVVLNAFDECGNIQFAVQHHGAEGDHFCAVLKKRIRLLGNGCTGNEGIKKYCEENEYTHAAKLQLLQYLYEIN